MGRANQMLRTVFRWERLEKPVQVLLSQKPVPIAVQDLSGCEQGQQAASLQAIRTAEYAQGVDLQADPFRLTLCRLSDTEIELVLTYHHILFDGWSTGLLLKEFCISYQSLLAGRDVSLTPKPSYKEFIRWHQRQDRPAGQAYWRRLLAGFQDKTRLPVRHAVASGASPDGGRPDGVYPHATGHTGNSDLRRLAATAGAVQQYDRRSVRHHCGRPEGADSGNRFDDRPVYQHAAAARLPEAPGDCPGVSEGTIHQRFQAQAARTPECVALVVGGCEVTYAELNERANRVASRLAALGVGPGRIVGLAAGRSSELIVGLLAILKAGGA